MRAMTVLFTMLVTPTLLGDSFEIEVLPIASPAVANDINDQGQVVGATGFDGFLLDDGVISLIQYPGAFGTQPTNINETGEMIGYYVLSDPANGAPSFGFHRDAEGNFTTITVPGAQSIVLWDFNASGDIVGAFMPAPPDPPFPTPFLLTGEGELTVLEIPGAIGAQAYGINDEGTISGGFVDEDFTVHGFTLHDGDLSVIEYPGATLSAAGRINNLGEIAGVYSNENSFPGQEDSSYLRSSNGEFSDFAVPNAAITLLRGINDHGDVTGLFHSSPETQPRAFIARRVCTADVNRDGSVDVQDLVEVILNWGPCPGCPADVTGDGAADVEDLVEVVLNWGTC